MNKRVLVLAASGFALGAALMSDTNLASAFSGTGLNAGQAPVSFSEFPSPNTLRLRATLSILGTASTINVTNSLSGTYSSALYWQCPVTGSQAVGATATNSVILGDITRFCLTGNAISMAGTLNDANANPFL